MGKDSPRDSSTEKTVTKILNTIDSGYDCSNQLMNNSPNLFSDSDIQSTSIQEHFENNFEIAPNTIVSEHTPVIILQQKKNDNTCDKCGQIPVSPIDGPLADHSKQEYVINSIAQIKLKMNQMVEVLQDLRNLVRLNLSNNSLSNEISGNSEIRQLFPLKLLSELMVINEKLKVDDLFKKELVTELMKLGGNSLKQTVYEALKFLLSYDLANNLTYGGIKKEKPGFSSLIFNDIILNVVRQHYPTATNYEISVPIKSWLRHANDRLKIWLNVFNKFVL